MNQTQNPAVDWDYPAPHVFELTVSAADIDGLNHANNAEYVRWCERAAWSHSERLGLSLHDYKRLDRAMAIRHAEFDYLAAALEGDTLRVATWLTGTDNKLSLERRFQLVRAGDALTLMRGRWSLVCIQISSGRPRRLPAEFLAAYGAAVVATDAL
ncbi:acyl-CoA thioesterase [Exilibacterium tricleocarpae]|uniref:Acyl-CoA thioesterase n=1 Tax=Exilibacterium tricleocarpae TaxID=2591008 RepID=A0A545SME5_9GAMM|nr:thioesterase family protein [Exilibacterium tricleocarpae]TQV66158.1 acyl-CoA thioesterase [Exilibacterium tricleocarpae]